MTPKMSGQIFISYRREDGAAWAGRLYDRLSGRFASGKIFMDVDSLAPGVDFVEALGQSVGACDALVAVIGERWLSAADETGKRRLENPEDFVRVEVGTALKRGVRVIPVLVDGASMPRSSDLPEDLKSLVRRQALSVSHDRFRDDSERLIDAVQQALEAARTEGQRKPEGQGQQQAKAEQRGVGRRSRAPPFNRTSPKERTENAKKPWRLLVVIGGTAAFLLLGFGLLLKPPRPPPAVVQPTGPATPSSNEPTSVINIAGNWRDPANPSYRSRITQEGNSFQFNASGVVLGRGFWSSGNGTISGQNVTCTYTTNYLTGAVSHGSCSGTVSTDGSRMTLTCTDSVLGTFVQSGARE